MRARPVRVTRRANELVWFTTLLTQAALEHPIRFFIGRLGVSGSLRRARLGGLRRRKRLRRLLLRLLSVLTRRRQQGTILVTQRGARTEDKQ